MAADATDETPSVPMVRVAVHICLTRLFLILSIFSGFLYPSVVFYFDGGLFFFQRVDNQTVHHCK